jgi:hypothetical protein
MNGKFAHGLLSGMGLEPYTTQRINCTQLPHQQLFQCLRVVSLAQEAAAGHAAPAGPRLLVTAFQCSRRAGMHASCLSSELYAALCVSILTCVHVCMSVCLRAHWHARARARPSHGVFMCMYDPTALASSELHDVARDAEGLHHKHSILDSGRPAVYHSTDSENMHIMIGNASEPESAKYGRLYARVFIHGCFAVTGPSTVAEKL